MANPWEFLETWAKENVHAILFGDEETARQLANSCLEAAKKAGISEAAITKVTCPRTFIQLRLESRRMLRRVARVEQHAIGEAGRGCAADRMLR
jgi:hypothetical protein